MKDLDSQQAHLSSTSYDLRITNLARFIYSRLQTLDVRRQTGVKCPKSKVQSPTSTFLDVGAGNGLFLKFFKSKGFIVSGFELEKKNVENMKKDPILQNENIRQGDITKLHGMQEYDVVIASDVIEHIKDDVLAIKNLWSFVAPGGLMVITVPAHSYLFGKRDEKWGHFRRYDGKLLLKRINEAIGNKNTSPSISRRGYSSYKEENSPLIKRGDDTDQRSGETGCFAVEFLTQWNIVGFYLYFLFEKILHKPINEDMRYSNSLVSQTARNILDKILQLEEMIGGLPLGLTLVVGVRKHSV